MFFFFNDTATTEIYTLSLHDAFRSVVSWFERIPYVEAATPRLSSTAEMNMTKNGKLVEENRVPIVGIDPFRDVRASTVHETVADGSYVFSRNSIVLGSNVARDLGGAEVGDSVKVLVVDRWGEDRKSHV